MPDRPDVPLDPAREPRVAEGEVRGLEDRVAEEQLPAGRPMHERPQAAPGAEEERCAQHVVLEDCYVVRDVGSLAAVLVLGRVGEDAADPSVPHTATHLLVGVAVVGGLVGVAPPNSGGRGLVPPIGAVGIVRVSTRRSLGPVGRRGVMSAQSRQRRVGPGEHRRVDGGSGATQGEHGGTEQPVRHDVHRSVTPQAGHVFPHPISDPRLVSQDAPAQDHRSVDVAGQHGRQRVGQGVRGPSTIPMATSSAPAANASGANRARWTVAWSRGGRPARG